MAENVYGVSEPLVCEEPIKAKWPFSMHFFLYHNNLTSRYFKYFLQTHLVLLAFQLRLIILKTGILKIKKSFIYIRYKKIICFSITLGWSKPKNDGGNPVSNYVVEKREKGTDKWLP